MSAIMTREIEAHQQINNMLRNLTSSKQKLRIIQTISAIGFIFAFFSIGGSGYGIYYDMLLDYGFAISLGVGALGGIAIEAVKMVGVWIFFSYEQLHIKLIGFAFLSLFTAFAIQLHFIGATNMEYTKRVMALQEIHQKTYALQERKLNRDDKVIDMMGDVLNNHTNRDDKIAVETIRNLDKDVENTKMSEIDRELYKETKEGARKRGNSMRKLLPLFEIFSIFGLLGAYLKTQSVTEETKGVIRVIDKHIEEEGSIAYAQKAVETISPTVQKVQQVLDQNKSVVSTPPPTQPPNNGGLDIENLTEEQKAQIYAILFKKKMDKPPEQPEKIAPSVEEKVSEEPSAPAKLISPKFSRRAEPTSEPDECEEAEYQETVVSVEKEYERAIDFSAFSEQEGVLIKILWNNGTVKAGEPLIDRSTVIKEASENFGIKRAGSILTNLYDNLRNDHKMIERPKPHKGYIAKVALKKELWTEKERVA